MQPINYCIWEGTFVSFYEITICTTLFPSENNTLEGAIVDVICADSIPFPTVLWEEKAGQPTYGAWVNASRTHYSEM